MSKANTRHGSRMPAGVPTINHMRVLRSIAAHQRRGTMYAPVGASYTRAKGLVDCGLAMPTLGRPLPGLQCFAVTLVGCELLASLDKIGADKMSRRYWLPGKPKG